MRGFFGRRLALAAAFLLGAAALPVAAQQAPPPGSAIRPGGGTLRIVLNSPAGSAADAVARAMAEALTEVLSQTVVVENVPAGGGVVGTSRVMQSRRDGGTILSTVSGALIGPMLDRSLPFEIGRDLIPVSQVTGAMGAFVVRSLVPATTVAEFAAWTREGRSALNIGNFGHGSSSHLYGLLLTRRLGLDAEAVTFNGTGPLTSELIAGRLCCAFIDTGSAREFVRARQIRVLAVTGPRRVPYMPDVPTFTELGIAGYEPQIWQGMFLPAGTPPEIVAQVSRAMAEAIRRPGPTRLIRDIGYEAVGSSPEEFAAMIERDRPIWRRIIEETGIRIN